MSTPNPLCRENHKRAVYLSGEINQELLTRLLPEIQRLRAASTDPITLYIDSPGGSTAHAQALFDLLKTPSQDGDGRHVITVAISQAASAAADLLASGDYAIAYPGASILYHGTRQLVGSGLTKEMAAGLSDYLGTLNQTYAFQLANHSINRMLFRYTHMKSEFGAIRDEHGGDQSDLDCLMLSLVSKAPRQREVLEGALDRYNRNTQLTDYIDQKFAGVELEKLKPAAVQAQVFKHIFDFELEQNDADESFVFDDTELKRVIERAQLLGEYVSPVHSEKLQQLAKRWGMFFLSGEQRDAFDAARLVSPEEGNKFLVETAPSYIRPIWHFCVNLCSLLQRGENHLSASDAYWLGIVDEIPGSDRPNLRLILENKKKIAAAADAKSPDPISNREN